VQQPVLYEATECPLRVKPEVVVASYYFRFAPETGHWYACPQVRYTFENRKFRGHSGISVLGQERESAQNDGR
jgi:hypothetical protein